MPLTYLRPALARETLQLIMHLTHADTGEIPYAFAGYGIHDGASVHEHPSDLDLYFLLVATSTILKVLSVRATEAITAAATLPVTAGRRALFTRQPAAAKLIATRWSR